MSAEDEKLSPEYEAARDAKPQEGSAAGDAAPAPEEASPTKDAPTGGEVDTAALEARVVEVLRTVYDPEIPVNIHELGMIYEVRVDPDDASAYVKMTLTTPMCPVAGTLPGEVEAKVAALPGVSRAQVELVWDPPWNPGMMSEAAKLQTGLL